MKKIWCFSDTHGKHSGLNVPENIDIAIFAGDAGTARDPYQNEGVIKDFLEWYKMLPNITNKIFIAGNHCTSIEKGFITRTDIENKGIIYLEHETKIIDGLKVFGSPYTPTFGTGWAYNVKRSKLDEYWKDIEEGTDIVVTHGPPLGILDHTQSGTNINTDASGSTVVMSCGDKSLLNHIKRVKPVLNIFGHIHDEDRCSNAGIMQVNGLRTKFINASVLNLDYDKCNDGIIIEI